MHLPPFISDQHFRQYFGEQLRAVLKNQQLGAFILVLANALSRPELRQLLAATLQQRFEQWQNYLQNTSAGSVKSLPADDLAVFKALCEIDLEQLHCAQTRAIDHWRLQYHPLRSLRPARSSAQAVANLQQPFNHQGFHFNKAFLQKELLWQGTMAGREVRLLYNKFPFADYHGLMVIDGDRCKPQFLQSRDCDEAQRIHDHLSATTTMGMAYNSLGAYASINHQHWQTFVSDQAYPIENECWQHQGGERVYPLSVACYDSLPRCYPEVAALQRNNQAFNLLLRAEKVYLIRRKRQGEYAHSNWSSGFAWSEVAGMVMTRLEKEFHTLDADDINQEFARLSS